MSDAREAAHELLAKLRLGIACIRHDSVPHTVICDEFVRLVEARGREARAEALEEAARFLEVDYADWANSRQFAARIRSLAAGPKAGG